jgi:hypothetical protein
MDTDMGVGTSTATGKRMLTRTQDTVVEIETDAAWPV